MALGRISGAKHASGCLSLYIPRRRIERNTILIPPSCSSWSSISSLRSYSQLLSSQHHPTYKPPSHPSKNHPANQAFIPTPTTVPSSLVACVLTQAIAHLTNSTVLLRHLFFVQRMLPARMYQIRIYTHGSNKSLYILTYMLAMPINVQKYN